MRPLPFRGARARTAAVQVSSAAPSAAVFQRNYPISRGGYDTSYLTRYLDWQGWARRYARQIGAANFAAAVIADCCARCDIRVEERQPDTGEWVESNDPAFVGIFDDYSNPLQTSDELIRLHAWHYQVAGEMVQTQVDGQAGVEYGVYSTAAVQWGKPEPELCTVRLIPDGKVDPEGVRSTAFVVPRDQVIRFWIPDQEWQAYATSPMASSIDDLHRWRALSRQATAQSESRIAMEGALWIATEALGDNLGADGDLDDDDGDVSTPRSLFEEQYYELAQMRFSDSDDIAAVAPPVLKSDKDGGKPEWLKLAEPLDPNGIAYRKEALEDFARPTNLPVTTVIGGGVGDANHWSEWLASDKFFDSGVAPTMDRICHLDLTRTFLWPRARVAGRDPATFRRIRMGYDPSPVIVHPDQSSLAVKMWESGLLRFNSAINACSFDEEDALTDPEERKWLLEVLARGREFAASSTTNISVPPAGANGNAPVGPATVVQGPPSRPMTPPPPPAVAAILSSVLAEYASADRD